MRVLHCLAQLPTRTGSGVYFHNVIREIDRKTDWEQAALYAMPASCEPADWLDCQCHYPVFFETEAMPFPIVGMSDQMPYPSTSYCEMDEAMISCWHEGFYRELLRIKERFRPDVIISHHLWILTSMVLEIFPDIPVIGISHGTDIRQAKHNPGIAASAVGSLGALDRVLALSDLQIQDLINCFDLRSEQIIVTGGAFDHEIFYPDSMRPAAGGSEQINFLYAGKMSHAKGVYELLPAFAELYSSNPDVRLDLVGTADAEMHAYLYSGRFPTEAIRLFDVESQTELARHMRHSDIFILASYYEGLGLIAIEALASGLALVSNKLPALAQQLAIALPQSELISWVDLPRLVNLDQPLAGDIPAYVSRLSKAMSEQAERARLTNGERERLAGAVQVFSWESLARQIISLVEQLLY